MSLEKGDTVVLHDKHSEFDGEIGEISQVSETMFGDRTFIVTFEDGQESGIPEDSLEPAPEEDVEIGGSTGADADETDETDTDEADADADSADVDETP